MSQAERMLIILTLLFLLILTVGSLLAQHVEVRFTLDPASRENLSRWLSCRENHSQPVLIVLHAEGVNPFPFPLRDEKGYMLVACDAARPGVLVDLGRLTLSSQPPGVWNTTFTLRVFTPRGVCLSQPVFRLVQADAWAGDPCEEGIPIE